MTTPALPASRTRPSSSRYSKANPGKLNLASPGATTLTRLSGEQFKQVAGLDWVTVHYKGGAPAMQDMLAGTAHVMFANISDVIAQVKAGKLRAIAVTTPKRSAIAPEVPTLAESGYPGFSFVDLAGGGRARGHAARGRRSGSTPRSARAMAQPEVKDAVPVLRHRRGDQHARRAGHACSPSEVAKIKRIAKEVGATAE